jgi:hypothetical protein
MTFGFGISLPKPPDILTHVDFGRLCETLCLIPCDLSDTQRPIKLETMSTIARIENDPIRIGAMSTDEGQVKNEFCVSPITSKLIDRLSLDGVDFKIVDSSPTCSITVRNVDEIMIDRDRDRDQDEPEARSLWNAFASISINLPSNTRKKSVPLLDCEQFFQ